jgi:hypothetical protein
VRETGNAGHFEVQSGHLDAQSREIINEANVGASMPAGLNDAQRIMQARTVAGSL